MKARLIEGYRNPRNSHDVICYEMGGQIHLMQNGAYRGTADSEDGARKWVRDRARYANPVDVVTRIEGCGNNRAEVTHAWPGEVQK